MEAAQQSLKAAAEAGNIDDLYKLIQEDPKILNRIDDIPFVDTPLHTAASAGHTSFAVEIMSLKPSFGRKLNPEGLSPLHLALQNNNTKIVKQLIKFDSELIRVKGRERLTPLHYIAKTDHIDLLAEFLYACPTSIEDLTIRHETAVHVAVKNSKLEAFQVLLGWLHRTERKRAMLNTRDEDGNTVLHIAVSTSHLPIVKLLVKGYNMNKNGRNLAGSTALDIAERLGPSEAKREIVKALRRAGASKSSSLPNDYSHAEFFMSREKHFESLFRIQSRMGRDMSMETRNVILVVAVLIATATFQAAISPPRGLPDHNVNLPTSGTADTATTNPYKRVLYPNLLPGITYEKFFYGFYYLNTVAFIASMTAIIIVLPLRKVSFMLHTSLVFLMTSYGFTFFVISPTFWYACILMFASYFVGFLVYYLKSHLFLHDQRCVLEGRVPLMPYLDRHQKQRLQMLHRLLGRT